MGKGRVVHTHMYIKRERRVHAYRESSTDALVWLLHICICFVGTCQMVLCASWVTVELTTQEILASQALVPGCSDCREIIMIRFFNNNDT